MAMRTQDGTVVVTTRFGDGSIVAEDVVIAARCTDDASHRALDLKRAQFAAEGKDVIAIKAVFKVWSDWP